MGDDRAEVRQSMNGLDVDAALRRVFFQRGTEVCHQVTRPDRCKLSMVDVYQVGGRSGEFTSIERCIDLRNDRPRVRLRCGLTGDVAGVEFGEGSVEVVGVEGDGRCEPVICIHFEDDEYLYKERL